MFCTCFFMCKHSDNLQPLIEQNIWLISIDTNKGLLPFLTILNESPATKESRYNGVMNTIWLRWEEIQFIITILQQLWRLQYIPRNMHTVFALLCFVVVIYWLIFPYPPGLLHWHCGNLTIAPVPAKQPWWIWINTSCEFIMDDCITTTKQSTIKPCAYFLGYTAYLNIASDGLDVML